MDRNEAIDRIRRALKARSGKTWSVTGGRGTAWGWINIDAPPKRRTWHFVESGRTDSRGFPEFDEVSDPSKPYGHMSPAEREELGRLLRKTRPVHHQGESIPASNDYRRWYVDLAEGRTPEGDAPQPYWD